MAEKCNRMCIRMYSQSVEARRNCYICSDATTRPRSPHSCKCVVPHKTHSLSQSILCQRVLAFEFAFVCYTSRRANATKPWLVYFLLFDSVSQYWMVTTIHIFLFLRNAYDSRLDFKYCFLFFYKDFLLLYLTLLIASPHSFSTPSIITKNQSELCHLPDQMIVKIEVPVVGKPFQWIAIY